MCRQVWKSAQAFNLCIILVCHYQVEKVSVETTFPKSVLSVTMTPSQGRYTFDPTTKLMTWDVGEMEPGKTPNLRGQFYMHLSIIRIKHT